MTPTRLGSSQFHSSVGLSICNPSAVHMNWVELFLTQQSRALPLLPTTPSPPLPPRVCGASSRVSCVWGRSRSPLVFALLAFPLRKLELDTDIEHANGVATSCLPSLSHPPSLSAASDKRVNDPKGRQLKCAACYS